MELDLLLAKKQQDDAIELSKMLCEDYGKNPSIVANVAAHLVSQTDAPSSLQVAAEKIATPVSAVPGDAQGSALATLARIAFLKGDKAKAVEIQTKAIPLIAIAEQAAAKATLEVDKLDAVADRGYFNGEEILACENAGISVTLPKPMTSNSKAEGRFGKQDFRYVAKEDVYVCPAGARLVYSFTTQENGMVLRRYATKACRNCAIKNACTTGKERRITRWEHEHVLDAVQRRLDEHPEKMRQRRETVEHPFGTIKARMGATHFLMKTLSRVATEMALHVLAYNLTRVMSIMGTKPLIAAMKA